MSHEGNGSQGLIVEPERNRYFYGKLLDVRHFVMEQNYINRKRWMLNRLGLGTGVLWGLELRVTDDGRHVWIEPGVAIDGGGREIIVTRRIAIDRPDQATDEVGRPEGSPLMGEDLTVCLSFLECEAEPMPVLVSDCDTMDGCANGTIRERFRVIVHRGTDAHPGLPADICDSIFPAQPPEGFDRYRAACERVPHGGEPEETTCVPIGLIRVPQEPGDALSVDSCQSRTLLVSNEVLLNLILCLADRRFDQAPPEVRRLLRYVSGDAQEGARGAELPEPLIVEVLEEGFGVGGEVVSFRVMGGEGSVPNGGSADRTQVETEADGRAMVRWSLGASATLNTLEATLESGERVTFHALAHQGETPPEVATPPFVEDMWPPHGSRWAFEDATRELLVRWLEEPRLELTFSRPMSEEGLAEPDRWLRLLRVRPFDQESFEVQRFPLVFMGEVDASSGAQGYTIAYSIRTENPEELIRSRWVVLARAEGQAILDRSQPPMLLDADFKGTRLRASDVENLLKVVEPIQVNAATWGRIVPSGRQLPSGDGAEGGDFGATFAIGIE